MWSNYRGLLGSSTAGHPSTFTSFSVEFILSPNTYTEIENRLKIELCLNGGALQRDTIHIGMLSDREEESFAIFKFNIIENYSKCLIIKSMLFS